jgi:hypothetical protein
MPMSGRAHQGYAGDPDLPMADALIRVMPVIRRCREADIRLGQ